MSKMTVATFPYQGETFSVIDPMGEPKYDLAVMCKIEGIPLNRVLDSLWLTHSEWLDVRCVYDKKGNKKDVYYVTEPGMFYALFFGTSEKCIAFQSWVCGEVLPKIKEEYARSLTQTNMEFAQTYFDKKFAQLESKISLPMNLYRNMTKYNDGGVTLDNLQEAIKSALIETDDDLAIMKAALICTRGNLSAYLMGAGYLSLYSRATYIPTEKGEVCGIGYKENSNCARIAKYRAEFLPLIINEILDTPYETIKETMWKGILMRR